MRDRAFRTRFLITASLLAGGIFAVHSVGRSEKIPLRNPLARFPSVIGSWTGTELPIPRRQVDAAAVTDYLSRVYQDGASAVSLYIGYYASQKTGEWVHSPKNCLPAAGWEPVRSGRISFRAKDGRMLTANEYIIAKGPEREVVIYWYQARGRVIASEYSSKFWMVSDAVRRNRTDTALIRVVSPATGSESGARDTAIAFIQAFYPSLHDYIPD
jgi:EpsI family protein